MLELLLRVSETVNMLFPVVYFLKCVVTEVVSFSIACKTLKFHKYSVATHFRCGGIFSDSIFDKVKAYKKVCRFLSHPVGLPTQTIGLIGFYSPHEVTMASSTTVQYRYIIVNMCDRPSIYLSFVVFTTPANCLCGIPQSKMC